MIPAKEKVWPNPNPPDNYGGSSQNSIDLDRQYGVPGFLFMAE